ncbi:MAG: hypothetical protein ACRET1_00105 [Burkholderiales bacterium]
MVTDAERFPIFIAVTLVVFVLILRFVTRNRLLPSGDVSVSVTEGGEVAVNKGFIRSSRPSYLSIGAVALIVVVGGMLFAKFGQNGGLPWWIYYTVPAVVTLALPPVAFRFKGPELWWYLALAFLSSPAIHAAFSFFLGWHNYMPFIYVPSLHDLLNVRGQL